MNDYFTLRQFSNFFKNVSMGPESKCWDWLGAISRKGYGQFKYTNTMKSPHRISYEFFNGPFSSALHVLHKCDNPKCVNPRHLFLGTNQDNVDDKMRKGRHQSSSQTHCKSGHEFNEENTIRSKRSDGTKNYRRSCRKCNNISKKKYRAKKCLGNK